MHKAVEKAASNLKKMFVFRRSEYDQTLDAACSVANVKSSPSTPEPTEFGELLEAECIVVKSFHPQWTPSNNLASKGYGSALPK